MGALTSWSPMSAASMADVTGSRRTPGNAKARAQTVLTAPFNRSTWRRYGYVWLAFLMAPPAFAYVVVTVFLAPFFAVTIVGLFAIGVLVAGARRWGSVFRRWARSLLVTDIPEPPSRELVRGFWRRLRSSVGDLTGWRALLFMLAMVPLSLFGFLLSTGLLLLALGLTTHWIWGPLTPARELSDGTVVRSGLMLGPETSVVTVPQHLLVTAIGLLLWFGWPWIVRPITNGMAMLSRALLGPTRGSLRVSELERSRAGAVEDADARLRRIERDLHDGTQARLVAVAMHLGEAKEQLESGGDPDQVAKLVRTAHTSTTETLAELRELARGIHPPVLDDGLAVALETLAARAPLPVTLDIDRAAGRRGALAPAVESIAYFTVAELVTNAAKHASASRVSVLVKRGEQALLVQVADDGSGGAAIRSATNSGQRSGLAGLVERAKSLDGSLEVDSPPGGPTVITVTLPQTVRP